MSGMTRPIWTVNVTQNTIVMGADATVLKVGHIPGSGTSLVLGTVAEPGTVLMLARNGVIQAPGIHWTGGTATNEVTLLETSDATDIFTYTFLSIPTV